MKINLKYSILTVLLFATILISIMWFVEFNQNSNIQEPFANQLSECQKISSSYIGLTEDDAIYKAKNENRSYRTVMRDGEGFMVTEDYSSSRLNFEISNDLVMKASCG